MTDEPAPPPPAEVRAAKRWSGSQVPGVTPDRDARVVEQVVQTPVRGVGPYGVLLAAFAQVTVGFVQLRRRDEAQSRVPSSPPIGGSPSGDQEYDDAEVHPDGCRACSRFDWWMPESQS